MKSDNIYQAINPKDKPCAFNSTTSFSDTAHEVTFEERQAAESRVAALIEQTRKSINE